ncbi:TetR/AcrR family transcriptional regulator [Nocardia sp. NBC_00403]|uniref:TetR/AcrR family transcriptional regulator n=1 Tax=Nocardia sp. NBC_00403 TaxID=2975990 RepID=UPI002E1F5A12
MTTGTRLTAAQRSEEVLNAAITAFAEGGYAGTKTDEIARLAGVSQPYVIRLFGTKQHLFLAALHRVCDRIEKAFRAADAERSDRDAPPTEALRQLGRGYQVFLAERELLQVFMHGIASSADPVIGDEVRARFGQIFALVRELTGAPLTDARRFIATGMLLTVMSAMQVAGPDAIPAGWAEDILENLSTEGD